MIIYRQEDVTINKDSKGNNVPMTSGNLIVNGQLFKVNSGGWGNGPLPSGLYLVDPAIRLPDTEKNAAYRGATFPWFARLFPQFTTSRDGFLIHPKGRFLGTLGCIEYALDDDEVLFAVLERLVGEKLKVI
jgi:hypothetical protein